MSLSRLDNFLKSVRGTILYVDPNNIDATDSVQNQGNSLTRPFRTIQRALVESARFSYQRGANNDRFNKTTIVLYPGDHIVDNRPGWIPEGSNNFRLRTGATSNDLTEWGLNTNFNLTAENNTLYKLNSIHGGVIVPRGTSIVGMDLRKTRIRPTYVPNPENDDIQRSAIFRITGGCYFWQFTLLDADPNGTCYKDYTTNIFVPNFSHHKLTCFEYADGVNDVSIDDAYQTYSTNRTDLDMYYEKVGICYGSVSGREIFDDYPSADQDFEPVIDEYRIVGSRGAEVGITSIRAGDGVVATTTITVTLEEAFPELNVDTPITIQGVSDDAYNGKFVVYQSIDSTTLTYKVQNTPANALPFTAGATLNINVDTVTSASPYIFNVSSRSVYGMCGMLADGNNASGFKSMVVAQYTGIGLQKDDNAFVKYDSSTGQYEDATTVTNLSTDSRSVYKPAYENFHIKATNDAYVQIVSVFAIGYANHFEVENGGDFSINNSNSNFGARALIARGFRKDAFAKDDIGYITHVISPQENKADERNVSFLSLDRTNTVGIASTNRLYFYQETNQNNPPANVIDGYRIGAAPEDKLYLQVTSSGISTEYSARIVMPNTSLSFEKSHTVGRSSVGINIITSNTITLTSNHTFENGETIRVISDNGHLPDGLNPNQIYYAITSGISANQVKIAQSLTDAVNLNPLTINTKGGVLKIVSRVSDKNSGDIGHPIAFDSTNSQWYVNVASASTENTIYSLLSGSYTEATTPRTYIKRTPDTRNVSDTVYRVRYVIPKDSPIAARPPIDGYVLQVSNDTFGSDATEIQKYFNPSSATLSNSTELRNPGFIATCSYSSGTASVTTELPHNLTIGSQVEVLNVRSANNPTGVANSFFNGTFTVADVSNTKQFSYSLTQGDPGAFQNDVNTRNTSLPYFKRKKTNNTYQVYRSVELQKYEKDVQDGIYHLTLVETSVSPTVAPFTDFRLSQPVINLYPQISRDNIVSDPEAAKCFAVPGEIGKVIINEPQNSISKQTIQDKFFDLNVGLGITDIISGSGTTHTIYTTLDHGFCGITSVGIQTHGSGYVAGTYYNARLTGLNSSLGVNATAVVTVGAGGTVTAVKIMHGGSSYAVGDLCALSGIGTVGSGASITVANIYNASGEGLSISGVTSDSYSGYNNLYKIIHTNNPKEIYVQSSNSISEYTTAGVGVTETTNASVVSTGKVLGISTFTYNGTTQTGVVTFTGAHGFKIGNKVRFGGATNTIYNGDFIVNNITYNAGISTSFSIVGLGTTSPSTGGTIEVYRHALTSQSGFLTKANEKTSGRLIAQYAGITTTLATAISSTALETSPIYITNSDVLGFKIGDYFSINDEIFKIKTTPAAGVIYAFRSVLGTNRQSHVAGDIVRKINPIPVELRRNSIARASGHTFEYLGYGPGNYSTAFPEKQDRSLSERDQLLAQSIKLDGGITIYTGMDDRGNFYTGNKKLNSSTGQEQIYDSPVPTVTGEDIGEGGVNIGFDVLSPLEINVNRSIRVGGGDDKTLVSQFDGPIVINEKVTSNSDKGIEAKSIFLQGTADVARKISFDIATPTTQSNPGDVSLNANPITGGYLGWVYTDTNDWRRFGLISKNANSMDIKIDSIEIGTGSIIYGSGNNVGIGTTIPTRKFSVEGDIKAGGNSTQGVILTSPNGSEFRLTVNNSGALVITSV
jgi:hypothetical protein